MSKILSLILTHQAPEEVERLLEKWVEWVPLQNILIAYGGPEMEFQRLEHPQKIFISDPRLRTTDHQRELQSYTAIYQRAGEWLGTRDFERVLFVEFDQVPLRKDFLDCFQRRLEEEKADVLANMLRRVDGTSYAHYLYHTREPQFHDFWNGLSRRKDRDVILSMLGTGSFWKREAFLAVAERDEPFPMYHELYIPTLAHHLGFRLRDLTDQNPWVQPRSLPDRTIRKARQSGAWMAHALKRHYENG